MDKTEKLKAAILKSYPSMQKFAETLGIPKTTLATGMKNGIGGMAFDKVIAMCLLLKIDPVTFEPVATGADSISISEYDIIKKYRSLGDDRKAEIKRALDYLTQINS